MNKPCPFCQILEKDSESRVIDSNDYGIVIHDGFPISKGHTLIIPKSHTASFFELENDTQRALFELLNRAKANLDKELSPDSYNIGINDGAEAGQTVPHCHIHLIPRYKGDIEDPRGGVRWIIPDKADYWS